MAVVNAGQMAIRGIMYVQLLGGGWGGGRGRGCGCVHLGPDAVRVEHRVEPVLSQRTFFGAYFSFIFL